MGFNRIRMIPALFMLLLPLGPVLAATQTSHQNLKSALSRPHADRWILALGVSEGYTTLSSASVDSSGSLTQLMGVSSWILSDWVLEVGAGFLTAKISGHSGGTGSGMSLSDYEMTNNAGVVSLSPQYRMTDRLQLGPIVELLYGEDVGFRPGIGFSGKTTAWLAGAQALYSFNYQSLKMRAGAQYLRSLDLPNSELQSLQATLQLGFSLL